MKKVLELQLQTLSHIVCSSFVFWTLYKQGVWSSNFTLRNLCTWDEEIKRFNPKQKDKLCTFLKYLPSQPTYLPSYVDT
jgi:hypothetical protein